MSDEADVPEPGLGERISEAQHAKYHWGVPISTARQAWLKTLADRQRAWAAAPDHQGRESYFLGVQLTGADVFWLAGYALAGPEGDVAAWQERLRTARDRGEDIGLFALRLEGAVLIEAHLEKSDLIEAHLERANLRLAHLERADLYGAYLEWTDLTAAHVEEALLNTASLQHAHLREASLQRTDFTSAHLENADLREAHLEGAKLGNARLDAANLRQVHAEGARFARAHLERAKLNGAHLEWAYLPYVHLDEAELCPVQTTPYTPMPGGPNVMGEPQQIDAAHLEEATLRGAHLEGADLSNVHLEGTPVKDDDWRRIHEWVDDFPRTLKPADLRGALFGRATDLERIVLGNPTYGYISVADARWDEVNLAVVDWTPFTEQKALLGDEQEARSYEPKPFQETAEERKQPRRDRAWKRAKWDNREAERGLELFQDALRANRQLATAMRDQGMNEEADHFAYCAKVLQTTVLWRQGHRFKASGSLVLDVVAGHGYKWWRTIIAYVLIILAFMVGYWLLGPAAGHTFAPDGALIFSVSSFHGRGFFPGDLGLENWVARLAALEAVIGLFIEISFIATFTQRFFAR